MRTATDRLTLRARYIPTNSRLILEHTNGSALYAYETIRGNGETVFAAMAFKGTAGKPLFNVYYRTEAHRDQKVASFKAAIEGHVARVAERRAVKSAWTNPLVAGDILYTCWGYDQTNTEFYAVTRVSGKRVWVREIAAEYTATGSMTGRTRPAHPVRFTGPETMHTAQQRYDGGASIKISSCVTAYEQKNRTEEHGVSSYA